jgi:hypothetical protein
VFRKYDVKDRDIDMDLLNRKNNLINQAEASFGALSKHDPCSQSNNDKKDTFRKSEAASHQKDSRPSP